MASLLGGTGNGLSLRDIVREGWYSLKAGVFRFVAKTSYRWFNTTSRSQRNYLEYVGNGSNNSIAVACVLWVCRAFPEAPIMVNKKLKKNQREIVDDFPLVNLVRRPNPFYSGSLLWHATIAEYLFGGNAYWWKIRNGFNQPYQLWWIPAATIEPKWPEDGTEFISHYEYDPLGKDKIKIDPKDIVHFRFGFDPTNIRKGLSPIASALREIYTDDEAASFTASILTNLGVPGLVIAPGDGVKFNQKEADNLKLLVKDKFGGDNRGEPLILSHKGTATIVGYNPQQMDLRNVRQKAEERISGVIGIPAIVAGLGAGLDRSTFANFKEAREAAYESQLIPSYRTIAEELDIQLLPDFGDPDKLETGFDLSRVRALQEDQDALHKRAQDDFMRGIATLNEARAMTGYEVLPPEQGNVFAVPINIVLTPVDQLLALPEPQPTAGENGAGNDNSNNPTGDNAGGGSDTNNSGGSDNNSSVEDIPADQVPVKSNGHGKTTELVKLT